MCNERNCEETNYANRTCVPYEQKIIPEGLAIAYVAYQKYCSLCPPEESLRKGTVFPELYKPYKKEM